MDGQSSRGHYQPDLWLFFVPVNSIKTHILHIRRAYLYVDGVLKGHISRNISEETRGGLTLSFEDNLSWGAEGGGCRLAFLTHAGSEMLSPPDWSSVDVKKPPGHNYHSGFGVK